MSNRQPIALWLIILLVNAKIALVVSNYISQLARYWGKIASPGSLVTNYQSSRQDDLSARDA